MDDRQNMIRAIWLVLGLILYSVMMTWGIGDAFDKENAYEKNHREALEMASGPGESPR